MDRGFPNRINQLKVSQTEAQVEMVIPATICIEYDRRPNLFSVIDSLPYSAVRVLAYYALDALREGKLTNGAPSDTAGAQFTRFVLSPIPMDPLALAPVSEAPVSEEKTE